MIINYPTGLYKTALPVGTKSGNITFVISNGPPPRTNLLFPKIPSGIVVREKEPKTISDQQRRDAVGELIYSSSYSSKSIAGDSSNMYEIGQVIDFDDNASGSIDPMYVSARNETKHNTNQFDYDKLQIDASEVALLNKVSSETQKLLSDKLNSAKEKRANAEEKITAQQKIINESNRNISALEVMILNSSEDDDIVDLLNKFENKKNAALEIRDLAIIEANQSAADAYVINDQLNAVSVVVK